MNIPKWPEQERPRERLKQLGAEALSDAELLAIILNQGRRGMNVLAVARELLVNFKGLRGLYSASFKQFCQQPGLGIAKYCQLQAGLELGRRHLQESIQRHGVIKEPQMAEQFIIASLQNLEQEVFACLFLDSQHRLIQFEKLFHGTIHMSNVHPREVVKRALAHNAAALIIAHNHPSGIATPSQADREVTQQIREVLRFLDIQLLDHIIVAGNQSTSFAKHGLL